METPSSSSTRITRSQALSMAANNSIPFSCTNEESEKGVLKARSALFDITNDSPIVGLAIGSLKTPSSTFSKKRMFIQNGESKQATTPGSGEALLRGQVKTLLQKVEEEAVISKISFEPRNLILEESGFVNSPMYLLAPTPANTPQISELGMNNINGSKSLTVSPVVAESLNFSQILDQQQENEENLEKNLMTKLLFTDIPEKFEGSYLSVDSEDDASVWSLQVNLSTSDEELEERFDDGVDELSEGLSKICVNDGAEFTGKYKRFVYESDGELEGEEDV